MCVCFRGKGKRGSGEVHILVSQPRHFPETREEKLQSLARRLVKSPSDESTRVRSPKEWMFVHQANHEQ